MPLHLRLLLPALTLALGTGLGFIAPIGLLFGGLFVVWVLAAERYLAHGLWPVLTLLGGISLAAHLIPGFTPWQLWPPRLISSDAAPYGLRLSWDKLLLGTTLLAWWLGQTRRSANSPKRAWLTCIATLLLVPLLAMALGLLAWQPKWPQGLLLWLAVNLGVAVLLYTYRSGDANMRSVWLCSRNDAIGNVAVLLAAVGVFGTGTAWPDLIVAVGMAMLGLSAAWQVIGQARRELATVEPRVQFG